MSCDGSHIKVLKAIAILGLSLKPPWESISNFNKLQILAQCGSILETQLNSTCPELGTAQPQLVLLLIVE